MKDEPTFKVGDNLRYLSQPPGPCLTLISSAAFLAVLTLFAWWLNSGMPSIDAIIKGAG